ncbi:Uncharacterized protein TCM_028081 [Theobroma cacao]|uniref:Uncharacterized protein n=1 Tax=Theobroma cacao TaxID=3641 RepID=A0A061G990_THECC|nr:Uncharacterized protein TCM_028081 [Theobroma cacao]
MRMNLLEITEQIKEKTNLSQIERIPLDHPIARLKIQSILQSGQRRSMKLSMISSRFVSCKSNISTL